VVAAVVAVAVDNILALVVVATVENDMVVMVMVVNALVVETNSRC